MAEQKLHTKEDRNVFTTLYHLLNTTENYVPRNYQTIGGMWTVDTYKFKDVTLQIMDEGYTQRIVAEDVVVTDTTKGLIFEKGDVEDLRKVLARVQ